MNKVAAVKKLNDTELELGIAGTRASWHQKYLQCDTIYVGGLPDTFTEQHLLEVLEQYGTILHVHLVRDSNTNASRGFAFVKYADPRSGILAVDNLNGFEVNGRSLRLDHADDYRDRDGVGVDTTPSGFEKPLENVSDGGKGLQHAQEAAMELDAEKRRENAVLNRLEQLRKRRKLNISDEPSTKSAGMSASSSEPKEPFNERSADVEGPRLDSVEKKQKREEKERRRREKETRKDERARIRKERAERRAARQNVT